MKMKFRISAIVFLVIVLIISLLFAYVEIVFGARIRTLYSVKKIDSSYTSYTVDYQNDYDLDGALRYGVGSAKGIEEFASKKVLEGLPISLQQLKSGCSAYYAKNEAGDYVYGRNFDWTNSTLAIVHTKPKNGYESISSVNVNYLGISSLDNNLMDRISTLSLPFTPLDGMNEKGLAVSVLMLSGATTNQDTGKTPIFTTVAIRLLLDKAATVDEAVKLLEQYDMKSALGAPYHFLISDAKGNSIVVEYNKNKLVTVKSDESFQVCTNFWFSKNDKSEYDTVCERYKMINDSLKKTSGIVGNDEGKKMNLLSSVSKSNNGSAQWSVFYNLSKKTTDIAIQSDYDNVYSYSLGTSIGNSFPFYFEIIVWIVLAGLIAFIISKIKRKDNNNENTD